MSAPAPAPAPAPAAAVSDPAVSAPPTVSSARFPSVPAVSDAPVAEAPKATEVPGPVAVDADAVAAARAAASAAPGALDNVLAAKVAATRWRRKCACGDIRVQRTAEGRGEDALKVLETDGERSGEVSFYGDVQWVINGCSPPDEIAKSVDSSSFRYAFQAGTTAAATDNAAIGEMVAFGGHAYVRSTRINEPEYFQTLHGTTMRTPAAGIVYPADAMPDAKLSVQRGGRTFLEIANDLYRHVNGKCDASAAAFGGVCTFRKLEGVAIARSATEGENIFEHMDKYYAQPPYAGEDVKGVVVGFIADMKESEKRDISGLTRVLYFDGAADEETGETSLCLHVHLVTLKPGCEPKTAQEVKPEDVDEVLHMLDSSTVESMEIEAWAITKPLEQHATMD